MWITIPSICRQLFGQGIVVRMPAISEAILWGHGQPQRLRRILLEHHLEFTVAEAVCAHRLREGADARRAARNAAFGLVEAIGHADVRAVRRRQGCGCVKHWSATAACYAAPIVIRVFRE